MKNTLKNELTIKWLGVAGFELKKGETTLLIDPYISRLSPFKTLFFKIRPNTKVIDKYITEANFIIVSHTHFDHVIDVPYIAKKTGAKVFGSKSLVNLMKLEGVKEEQFKEVTEGESIKCGDFRVKFIKSLHNNFFLGKTPLLGDISLNDKIPLRVYQYRCGKVFGIYITCDNYKIYHQGSCNFIEENITEEVDLFLMGLAKRNTTLDYTKRILEKLKPKIIIPCHYENFFIPIDKKLKLMPKLDFDGWIKEVESVLPDAKIITLNILEERRIINIIKKE